MAQKWADKLAEINTLKHSDYTHKGDQLGENIASKWSSTGADYTGQYWYKYSHDKHCISPIMSIYLIERTCRKVYFS